MNIYPCTVHKKLGNVHVINKVTKEEQFGKERQYTKSLSCVHPMHGTALALVRGVIKVICTYYV